MKKKLLSLLTAATVVLCASASVMADTEKNTPKVFVDDELIVFSDQQPVIMDDFTMIPVRGVFNAMGAKVDWNGETQTVTINSRNNMIRIKLTIGSNVMKVYNFIDLMKSEETLVTLEAPPVIINDNETYRTLIPLRAISESLKSKVVWDGEEFAARITTPDIEQIENKATFSLSSDKTTVEAGEDFSLYIDLKNIASYPERYVGGVTASIEYDKENFEFKKSYLCNADGEAVSGDTGGDNPNYIDGSLKVIHITIDKESMAKTDGHVLKLDFTAKTSNPGTFKLMNRYNTAIGHDTSLLFEHANTRAAEEINGNKLIIDQTPVIINAQAEN